MCVCVCVCVCVCMSKDCSFLSWNICRSSSAISKNNFFEIGTRYVYCKYTPVSVFWAWEGPLLSPAKLCVLGTPEEYLRLKCQRAAQLHINPREIFFFCVLQLWTYHKKTFESRRRELRQRVFLWAQRIR